MNIKTKGGMALLGCALASLVGAADLQPYFAEPLSGQRVQSYQIELMLTRSEKRTFTIPQECQSLSSALISGAGQWGGRIDRRMWLKVDDDCRYYSFLQSGNRQPSHDYVSNYDFWNAKISDLPLHPGCDPILFLSNPAACPPPMPGVPDFFEQLSPPDGFNSEDRRGDGYCQFEDGVFRGHIIPEGTSLRCIPNKHASGFRILSVDYADVNKDGYMDAVLRMIPLGSGFSPVPLILPLTRTDANSAFAIPRGADFPTLGPNGAIANGTAAQ